MSRGRKAAKVKGISFREGRGWVAQYRVGDERIRKQFGSTPEDRQQAVEWLNKARYVRQSEGAASLPNTATTPILTKTEKAAALGGIFLTDLCDQYLKHIQNPHNPDRPTDQVNPPSRIARIKLAFADRRAASIKPYEIKDWLISLGRSGGTLNRYKSTLSAVFAHAKERELVAENPCRDVPHFNVFIGDPRWMDFSEEDRLRAVIHRWIEETPEDYKITRLLLREHLNEITVGSQTGMRKGNQYRLNWKNDINLHMRLIHLPKTKSGKPHTIPMTDGVYMALRDQQAIQEQLEELRGVGDEPARLRLDGRVFVIRENREWFERAKKEAQIEGLRWHDLSRHTAGSRLASSGANQKVIQEV